MIEYCIKYDVSKNVLYSYMYFKSTGWIAVILSIRTKLKCYKFLFIFFDVAFVPGQVLLLFEHPLEPIGQNDLLSFVRAYVMHDQSYPSKFFTSLLSKPLNHSLSMANGCIILEK